MYQFIDSGGLYSPILAARIVHIIPGYDENIGKFKYDGDTYVINPQGYYNLSISSNAEICTKGSGTVGGAVSDKSVTKVSPSLKNTLK